jgi:hypothetical protein
MAKTQATEMTPLHKRRGLRTRISAKTTLILTFPEGFEPLKNSFSPRLLPKSLGTVCHHFSVLDPLTSW